MKLQELKVGAELTLIVEWGTNHYEIPMKIVLSMQDRVFVSAFSYNGTTVDLASVKNYNGMIFHMVYNDPEDKKRLTWKCVSLETREVKQKIYYEVLANTFSSESREENRRNQVRLPIRKPCKIELKDNGFSLDGEVYDISQGGISFRCDTDLDLVGVNLLVQFSDEVREHSFDLDIPCRCVRRLFDTEKGVNHFGCQIISMDRDILSYIALKTANLQAEAAAAKRKEEEQAAMQMAKKNEEE